LSKVKELGLQENTLVFFTSDNGPWLVKDFEGGSAGLLRDGKGSTWDGGMREPAIAWWPGTLPAGVVNHNVATSLDLFPTTTALGGWQRPDTLELDGEDILGLLKGGEPKQDDSVYFYRTDKLYAMRKGPWKAHFTTIEGVYEENRIEDHTPPLLFNLERDPSETVNLASEYPQVVAEMVALRTEHETGVTKRPSQLIEWLKPADQVFKIKRGTNISHWLSQSRRRGEERLTFFTREDVEFLAGIGFDHLRIPIDEEQMWNEEGKKNEEAFQLLDNALDWCAEFNLRAIVDLHILRSHHFNAEEKPLWTEPSAQEHFLELWRDLSAHLKNRPVTQVAYEPMNEPVADDPEDWNNLVAKAVSVIRENELERIIFIGSNRWQQTETFDQLRIPSQDPNIYLSFHFYEPFALTHHQASWTGIKDYKGPVRYPGKTVLEKDLVGLAEDLVRTMRPHTKHFDRQMIVDLIQEPLALARKTGLPLYCGEWGALPTVPEKDRLRWYSDMRSVLEEHGIAWTTWDYKGGFGIVDGERKPRQKLIDVLLK
jgi:endoglucanase